MFRFLIRLKSSDGDYFQSPFSGDFLCFNTAIVSPHISHTVFQSPFSGDFLCFGSSVTAVAGVHDDFQSPFSGDFLCFHERQSTYRRRNGSPFNLHFQEIFFVSSNSCNSTAPDNFLFQSPFSGDFLCFANMLCLHLLHQ